jgi:hypothetical protein
MDAQVKNTIEPLAVPVAKAHLLVGCSQSTFYKIWVGEGWISPVDLGGRGQSVIVDEVREAMRKRAEAIRAGAIVPPIRSARGKIGKEPKPLTDSEGEVRELTVADFKRMQPFSALPKSEQAMLLRKIGRPKSATPNPHSWDIATWPTEVWPHEKKRAQWIARAYRKELIAAGAMSRVGKTLVFIGAPYTRWLERRARHVVEYASNNAAIGNGAGGGNDGASEQV